jgi:hypothetical protein
VRGWFADPAFFDVLEGALKNALRNKSKIREFVIESAIERSQAKLTDCLYVDPLTGELSLLDLNDIPEGTKSCLKELSIGRVKEVADDGTIVYRDCLNIKLMDTTQSLKMLGDWVDIAGEEKKRLGAGGSSGFTGLTLIPPSPKVEELPYADNNEDAEIREVLFQSSSDGLLEEVGESE